MSKGLKEKVTEAIGITGAIVLIVLLVIIGPLIGIWAVNTLFSISTPYTFWTWLASIVFFGMLKTTTSN